MVSIKSTLYPFKSIPLAPLYLGLSASARKTPFEALGCESKSPSIVVPLNKSLATA